MSSWIGKARLGYILVSKWVDYWPYEQKVPCLFGAGVTYGCDGNGSVCEYSNGGVTVMPASVIIRRTRRAAAGGLPVALQDLGLVVGPELWYWPISGERDRAQGWDLQQWHCHDIVRWFCSKKNDTVRRLWTTKIPIHLSSEGYISLCTLSLMYRQCACIVSAEIPYEITSSLTSPI